MKWNVGSLNRAVRLGTLTLLMTGTAGSLAAQPVELVSSADPGNLSLTPEGASTFSSFSADGRYTVFVSDALNVLPGQQDANGKTDVFLHDLIAGTTGLVSSAGDSDSPVTANAESWGGWISADGRYVLFASKATNVISGQIDSPGSTDLFLYDRVARTKALVSRSSQSEKKTGNAGSSRSWFSAISADGRYVAFASEATDLVKDQEDSNSGEDLFLYDRTLRTTTLVSRSAGFPSKTGNEPLGDTPPSISADGGQILFSSTARDLLPGGTFGEQLFLFNRLSGTATLVSHVAGSSNTGASVDFNGASLSSDGNYAAFYSTGELYLYERASGAVTLVAEGISGQPPRINANGRYVAFLSSGLVPGEAHHGRDVFLYDRISKTIELASRSYTTTSNIHGQLGNLSISADGRFVAFTSELQDLVPGQNDPVSYTPDVFVYDRVARKTRLVSHRSGSSMDAAGGSSGTPAVSADGRSLGFTSSSGTLAEGRDFNRAFDAFLYDLRTDAATTVSLRKGPPSSLGAGSSKLTAVSADGRYVLFQSMAPNVVPNQQDANDREYPYTPGSDVFLYDRVTRTKTLVSRSAASPTTTGNNSSGGGGLSADGRYALFLSYATDLVPGQVSVHAGSNVFLFDRITGTTTLVSHSAASPTTTGNSECFDTGPISTDNRYLVFTCFARDLVAGQDDTNQRTDVFLYDRVLNSSLLVSRAAGSAATSAGGRSDDPVMSDDGRFVAFRSFASNLVPGQDASIPFPENVFLFDRVSGTTALVSHALSDPAKPGDLYSSNPVISADGRFVAFTSYATDLVLPPGFPGPSTNEPLYLFDRASGAISRATTDGEDPAMSADGRFMVFSSKEQNLVPGQIDPNGLNYDIFLYDRVSGTTELVSRRSGSTTTTGNRPSGPKASLSADGNVVAFFSSATDLIPGQVSPEGIYLYDRTTRTMELAGAASFPHVLSANGRYVAFERKGGNPGADNNFKTSVDIYLYAKGSSTAGPTPLPACTLLDTRRRADRPVLTSNVQRAVTARGACGVPATAKQVVVKVTVFNPSGKGNLRFYSGTVTPTPAGILRFERGATRTETFTLPLSANGTLTILPFVASRGTVHVAVEVNGYSQ